MNVYSNNHPDYHSRTTSRPSGCRVSLESDDFYSVVGNNSGLEGSASPSNLRIVGIWLRWKYPCIFLRIACYVKESGSFTQDCQTRTVLVTWLAFCSALRRFTTSEIVASARSSRRRSSSIWLCWSPSTKKLLSMSTSLRMNQSSCNWSAFVLH